MKNKIIGFLIAVAVIVFFFTKTDVSSEINKTTPIFSGNTYSDSEFGFSFQYPDSLVVSESPVAEDAREYDYKVIRTQVKNVNGRNSLIFPVEILIKKEKRFSLVDIVSLEGCNKPSVGTIGATKTAAYVWQCNFEGLGYKGYATALSPEFVVYITADALGAEAPISNEEVAAIVDSFTFRPAASLPATGFASLVPLSNSVVDDVIAAENRQLFEDKGPSAPNYKILARGDINLDEYEDALIVAEACGASCGRSVYALLGSSEGAYFTPALNDVYFRGSGADATSIEQVTIKEGFISIAARGFPSTDVWDQIKTREFVLQNGALERVR